MRLLLILIVAFPMLIFTNGASAQSACPLTGSATNITGAGSTFAAPIYQTLFQNYANLCSVQVNYQAIGSGGGIQQLTQRTVDFGASDGIMNTDQKAAAPGVLAIPTFAGPVAIVTNIPGVASGQLQIDGTSLAEIYLGEVSNWDDPRISTISPIPLPDIPIITVHRSDGSGTTNIFTTYLSQINNAWLTTVGAANSVNWPTGVGGEGSAGVAGEVAQLPGSIGYVEYTYATQNNLQMASLYNSSEILVAPTLAGTTAAMDGVTIPDSTEVMITNSASPQAYPISGFTWVLVYQNQTDPAVASTLVSLLTWMVNDGQSYGATLGYAPLSAEARDAAAAQISKIHVN